MRLFFGISLMFTLACGGLGDLRAPGSTAEAVPAPLPPPWTYVIEDGQALVRAGTISGIEKGQELVLLGPTLADTDNRQVVGTATVAEVWPDLVRVEPGRARVSGPEPVAARPKLPEDQVTIDGLPSAKPRTATRTVDAPAKTEVDAPVAPAAAESPTAVPADLTTGTVDSRIEALENREKDPEMTAAIVWVMKNDTSADVQFKAWRVVRARWNRGTGSAAAHEQATGWAATNGPERMRIEALELLGEKGSTLGPAVRGIGAGSPSVRIAAAVAMRDMARRTGKTAEARKVLEARRDIETETKVRNKINDCLGDL